MKKIFFTLIAVVFASSLCFAEQPAVKADETASKVESVQQPSAKGEETKIFIGKVEKVTPLLGGWSAPYNKIVVTDDKGSQETIFCNEGHRHYGCQRKRSHR